MLQACQHCARRNESRTQKPHLKHVPHQVSGLANACFLLSGYAIEQWDFESSPEYTSSPTPPKTSPRTPPQRILSNPTYAATTPL
eukprot:38330-Pleurochrysis_carterae.AAC.2